MKFFIFCNVEERTGFNAALRSCIACAGPDNYCPVLAGPCLGALSGRLPDNHWIDDNQMLRANPGDDIIATDAIAAIGMVADQLAATWL